MGNFLVRPRVREIIQAVLPGACSFVQTIEKKSSKRTEWFLAVPSNVIDLPDGRDRSGDKQRCSVCGEPKLGYYFHEKVKGTNEMRHIGAANVDSRGLDIFKSRQWHAVDTLENQYANALKHAQKNDPPVPWSNFGARRGIPEAPHKQRWSRVNIDRDLFFSLRLEQLLKRLKVKGQLVRNWNYRNLEPSQSDLEWIEEMLRALKAPGPTGEIIARIDRETKSSVGQSDKWFGQYLKKNASNKKLPKMDFASIEKKHKIKLPEAYKAFMTVVGPKSFEDVNATEGFTANVSPPNKLDFKTCRQKMWKKTSVESDVDGVIVAVTDHGDVFVFDISAKPTSGGDYPIYWLDHEQNTLEPFAPDFATCIKRFVQRN